MVTVRLMVRMGTEPILPIKRSVSIGTMLNFDGDRHGDGDGTCKQALSHYLLEKIFMSQQNMTKIETSSGD